MNTFQKLSALIIFSLILIPAISLAQREAWTPSQILSFIFGQLPRVCTREITSQCMQCLVYVKIFPFLFILAIIFLILSYTTWQILPRRPYQLPTGEIKFPTFAPFEMKVISIVSVILALMAINIFPPKIFLQHFMFWIGLLFFILLFLLVRAFATFTLPIVIFAIILFIIIFLGFWTFISGMITPVIQGWITTCL
jgi:hypothetical protein